MKFKSLRKIDPLLFHLIFSEEKRQRETIDLIASENFAPEAVLEVLGSVLTNKYSEGYPGKRYYSGNVYYDEIERLAQKRALKAFDLDEKKWAVNVQPYSGSPANLEIYSALLNPGDVILGMNLFSGGHLTHGHPSTFSGKIYKAIQYGINPKTEKIDYQEIENLAEKYKPKIIISGASAYPREIDFKKIGKIAKKIGAYHLTDISHIAGLILAGLHQSPFNSADIVMTTIHKTLRGPRGAVIFSRKELSEAIDKAVFPGMQGGPHNNTIAAIALAFYLASKKEFKNYQKQIIKNAKILAESLKKRGFNLLSGGTDNHLLVINLKNIGLDGFSAEKMLENAGIIANRNSLFFDKSPYRPSGLRIGTPAITSLGMEEKEMKKISDWIYRILIKKENLQKVKREVLILRKKF